MKFWLCLFAFVFILTFGTAKCGSGDQSIFLMTNESIIGIDLENPSNPIFRHEISRNLAIKYVGFEYVNCKAVRSSSKELRAVDANTIVSFDLSDTGNIKQKVMFNSSTYPSVTRPKDEFELPRNFITGMTVDPMTSTTYLTTSKLISVMNSDRKWRTLIEFDEKGKPIDGISDICLISSESRLYWLSNQTDLYSAFTDGSEIKKLDVNLQYDNFTQMVADQNRKVLYLLSKSDRIVIVNTTNLEVKTYEKAIRSIAVDAKTGDVFITEFDAIKKQLVLKKFDPFNALKESTFSIILRGSTEVNSSNHSIVVHNKDDNWKKCEDCDDICLRKRDNTTTCECQQGFIRDQKSGKCKTPEKRLFYLSKNNRIISQVWPDNTTEHSINIAGNAIEFQHFAVDYTRDLVYASTFENEIWKFSPNGTFFIKTHNLYTSTIISLDVDVVVGRAVVMTRANESTRSAGKDVIEDLCAIQTYSRFLNKDWNSNSRSDRPVILFRQHFSCQPHMEIDEINGKMFFTTEEGIRSANMNGKNIRLIIPGDDVSFSLDKKNRRILYKRDNGDNIESSDYAGRDSMDVFSLKNVISLKYVNEALFVMDRENKLHRATRQDDKFINEETMSLSNLSSNESTIGIIDFSQPIPSTECSTENGGCNDICIISNERKQCLCQHFHVSRRGKCGEHSQFLAYFTHSHISLFNPDKESFQPHFENYEPTCKPTPWGLTFDGALKVLYFSDKNGIFSLPSTFSWRNDDCEPVVKIDGIATSLTIDVFNQDLYFIYDNYKIMKVFLKPGEIKDRTLTLIYESKNKNDIFSHLQYENCTKSLFFSNNNQQGSSIEAYKLQEREHRTIVGKLDFVYGMAIDREVGKIYYSHKNRKQVTRVYYNGKYSEDLMNVNNNQSDFGDIAVIDDDLIYLHNNTEFVAVHKTDMKDKRTILRMANMTFLASIEVGQDVCPHDQCYNGELECSDLCEPIDGGKGVCMCHSPRVLDSDSHTCVVPSCSKFCLNRSFCASMNKTDIECSCQSGFYGKRCDQKERGEITDCFNGGFIDHSNNCICPKGLGGSRCERQEARNCGSFECLNGGICQELQPFSPRCNCTDGFYGENCAYHDCKDFCKNDAACYDPLRHELPFCDCHVNMYGRRCDKIIEINVPPQTNWLYIALGVLGIAVFAGLVYYCYWKRTRGQRAWPNHNRGPPAEGGQLIPLDILHEEHSD